MKNVYLQIPFGIREPVELVIATVTSTEGSTPQKPGSSALFNRDGLVAGTVGGGVLEGRVQMKAIESIDSKKQGIHQFRLDASPDGEGALCGGRISVLIDPLLPDKLPVFDSLQRSAKQRIPGVLITLLTEESKLSAITRFWTTGSDLHKIPAELLQYIEPEINDLLSGLDSYDFREKNLPPGEGESVRTLFLEPVIPPPRLVIAGAGHIGKALSQIGKMLDFEITVIDDREEYANYDNIPWADKIIADSIGQTVSFFEKGPDTFIVIVTRGHRDDGNALKACIGSNAAYIGMIGSKTKVALMKREFIQEGWATEEQWNRIYAPVGVNINSKTVEEIAVSIAAQIVMVKNKS